VRPEHWFFASFVALTLAVTRWAARRTHSRQDFYTAHARVTAMQNGLAIAGDYMSASSVLGITALFYTSGHDGFVYLVGGLVGWPIVLALIGERLRNLGRFTFGDACALRLEERPTRLFAATSTVLISLLYMIAQMIGAGSLIEILFGIPFEGAVVLVGALMCIYVLFGGMLATTWVQIIKAVLMMLSGLALAALIWQHFKFSLDNLLAAAGSTRAHGAAALGPGGLFKTTGDVVSFGLCMIFGPAGLPHMLTRFFTVRDAEAARHSTAYASTFIGIFYLLVAVFGFASLAVLADHPQYGGAGGQLPGGNNMAVMHLARLLGGPIVFGLMAAVVFSTILAVVSGLSMTVATTVAHDLYGRYHKGGAAHDRTELWVARSTVLAFGAVSILLSIAFKRQNITFMVVTAFSIAASVNFPVLFATLYARKVATRAVLWAGWIGLLLSVVLTIIGPTVWVGVFKNSAPIFPYQYSALVVLPLTAAILVVGNYLSRSPSRHEDLAFVQFQLQSEIGPLERP
jgi:cation/acetate symporter